jgi:ABC-type multidrug transport system permease subunit
MASDKEKVVKGIAGCGFLVIWFFLVQPLWYALLFGILQRIESEPWMWICFWIYVPAGLIAGIISHLFLRLNG